MSDKATFGELLTLEIGKRKMIYTEVARMYNVSHTSVYKWCCNYNLPRRDILERICSDFGIDMSEFYMPPNREYKDEYRLGKNNALKRFQEEFVAEKKKEGKSVYEIYCASDMTMATVQRLYTEVKV